MSRATDFLLSRNGRDQFGNPGNSALRPAVSRTAHDDAMWALHASLHEQLVEHFGAAWLTRHAGKSRREVLADLTRGHDSVCALSTFNKMVREFESYDAFLPYWLLTDKRYSLTLLDVPVAEIDAEMAKYDECGRFMVSYGGSSRIFQTNDWRNVPKKRWQSGVGWVERKPVPPVRLPEK